MTTLCSLSIFADQPTLPPSGTVFRPTVQTNCSEQLFRPTFTGSWKMFLDIISIWSVTVVRIRRTLEKFGFDNTVRILTPFWENNEIVRNNEDRVGNTEGVSPVI
jgi:hypothetical protein